MEINKYLFKQAKRNGACFSGCQSLLLNPGKPEMMQLFFKYIDYCIQNDFPSNEFIREHFVGEMEKYGIHLDEHVECENERKVAGLGKCELKCTYNGYGIGEIFLKNDSIVNVYASDNSFVMVDIFDDSVCHVYAKNSSRVCVNVYGDAHAKIVEKDENAHVRITNKNKKTY